ncbi:hypothetical protein N0O92_08475 [Alkalihalobacillus sp. MEB130]|uniref:hypothetical protein n=1 Tax=Alkalihalobacillus sp. MEB130 TaxID=2976704 RepID=UPI0028DD4AC0|nr:hypothetical protein [Alkalihalobacillus sp. MEB130]MDT8860268.1 hypothetical protein [Alkalihalobacillus sp. MEB130]
MKKLAIIVGVFLSLLVVTYGLVGNYFYNFAFNADREKEFLEGNPHLEESEAVLASVAEEADIADELFKQNHQPEQVNIISNDKKRLNLNGQGETHYSKCRTW